MRSLITRSRSIGPVATALVLCHLGCSEAVPPPPQGAARIRTTQAQPPDPGKSCTRAPNGHTATIPPGSPINKDDPGHRLANGEEGTSVTCRVLDAGGTFNFSGTIEQNGNQLDVSGTVSGTAGTANVATLSPMILSLTSTVPCTVTVNAGKIAAGYIYAEYLCPKMGDASEGTLQCRGDGTFVFENCVSE